MPLPFYSFRQGDSIGVLIVADEQETVGSLAQKVQEATSIRVTPAERVELVHRNRVLDANITLSQAGLAALDRIDVREERSRGISEAG